MDERIDLTENRDFRREREPYFKDAHFFNFKPKTKINISMQNAMKNRIKKLENSLNKEIIVRDGRVYLEKSCNIIDHDNKIIECHRCGKKMIFTHSTLCDRCHSEVSRQVNGVLDTRIRTNTEFEMTVGSTSISIVNSEAQLVGINEE